MEAIWADERAAAYELTSVFIHRGSSPSWGHYFFYSRHLPEEPDAWFKYNDSDVGVVAKEEVLADTTGSTANPYMVRVLARSLARARCFGSLIADCGAVCTACVCQEGRGRRQDGEPVRPDESGGGGSLEGRSPRRSVHLIPYYG